jgi:hypothetical protein
MTTLQFQYTDVFHTSHCIPYISILAAGHLQWMGFRLYKQTCICCWGYESFTVLTQKPEACQPICCNGKAIPVTGRGGPLGCKTSRFPQCLDNRLTDGGQAVSLKRQPPFTRQENSWYLFLLEAVSTPRSHSAAKRIRSVKKIQWPHQEPNRRPCGL